MDGILLKDIFPLSKLSVSINPLLKIADQHKISLCDINALKNGVVMIIACMIRGDES